jgi:hypothetical protein
MEAAAKLHGCHIHAALSYHSSSCMNHHLCLIVLHPTHMLAQALGHWSTPSPWPTGRAPWPPSFLHLRASFVLTGPTCVCHGLSRMRHTSSPATSTTVYCCHQCPLGHRHQHAQPGHVRPPRCEPWLPMGAREPPNARPPFPWTLHLPELAYY